MKIGITVANLQNLDDLNNFFTNGLNQHLFTLKRYLEIKNEIYLISETQSLTNNFNYIKDDDYEKIAGLDIIITIGLGLGGIEEIKNVNPAIKIIHYSMGNIYHNGTCLLLNFFPASSNGTLFIENMIDEIWINPHFEFAIDYYKYIYNTENVLVAPFFWSDYYIREAKNKILKFNNDVHIAVLESNIREKNFIIPMIACEKAKEYITTAKIFNVQGEKINQHILRFFNNSELYKTGKLTGEDRYPFSFVMSEYCNIVISHVDNCDLNYLYLECFYLGIPLIHNSKMLKDYGYYYESCDATKAAEHIKNLKVNGFDREAYISKHKEVLFKYSLENPRVTNFIDTRLELLANKPITNNHTFENSGLESERNANNKNDKNLPTENDKLEEPVE